MVFKLQSVAFKLEAAVAQTQSGAFKVEPASSSSSSSQWPSTEAAVAVAQAVPNALLVQKVQEHLLYWYRSANTAARRTAYDKQHVRRKLLVYEALSY